MKTKTFVTDDYQVTLMDDGGVMVLFKGETGDTCIAHYEDYEYPWLLQSSNGRRESTFIGDLRLSKRLLEKLYEALKLVDKQDLMDDEIVFVDKEKKIKRRKKTKEEEK